VSRGLAKVVRDLPDGADVVAAAEFTVYNPEAIAGALAVAVGVAAIGGTGAGAAGVAVDHIMAWGTNAKKRLLPLPHRVVLVVSSQSLTLREKQGRRRLGPPLVTWGAGEFSATVKRRHLAGEVELWLKEGGHLRAVVSAKSGPLHHAGDECAAAVEHLANSGRPLGADRDD
jgi:hypothetical protein